MNILAANLVQNNKRKRKADDADDAAIYQLVKETGKIQTSIGSYSNSATLSFRIIFFSF